MTIPRGGNLKFAEEFTRRNSAWIERQLGRASLAWDDGTMVLFRGEEMRLSVAKWEGILRVQFADQEIEIGRDDDLRCAVEARMRTIASGELPARTMALAGQLGMEVERVAVRNQRARWGSCSIRRRISLNWRLIQAPELVRDYIIVHELMHLKEMNHSSRFWAHVEAAFPAWREAERWLRQNSRLLR